MLMRIIIICNRKGRNKFNYYQQVIYENGVFMTNHGLIQMALWLMLFSIYAAPNHVLAAKESADVEQNLRIVSAGGSVTEILFALGMGENIVATDTSSSFPADVQHLPKIGYYRQLSSEGVLSMTPSHVFAAQGAGPLNVLEQVERVGIEIHILQQQRSIAGLTNLIVKVGELVGKSDHAQHLNTKIAEQLDALPSINSDIKPVFLMSANERGLMAAGSQTVPDLLMTLLGIENPYRHLNGFKPISTESLLEVGAQLLFIPKHQTQGLTPSQLCDITALKVWSQLHGCNIVVVDSLLFLGMTPRLPIAANQMAKAIQSSSSKTVAVTTK